MAYTISNTTQTGTVSVAAGGVVVTGVGTNFGAGSVGFALVVGSQWGFIRTVSSATSCTLDRPFATAVTGQAFAFATGVNQTGTDTSLAGLDGLAGVMRLSQGDGFLYWMPSLVMFVQGTLTNADPAKNTFICNRLSIQGTGNFTSGAFAADGVTPLRGGSHFEAVGGALQAPNNSMGWGAFDVATGGRYTFIGGTYSVGFGIYYQVGSFPTEHFVSVYSKRDWGGGSARVRSWTTNLVKNDCVHYDIGLDLFLIPTVAPKVRGAACEYVYQYVGSRIPGGVDARFVASALSNPGGGSDFHNWGAGWCELYNCAKGADLNVIITSTETANRHLTPLFQDINLSVTNLAGVPQQNVRFRCVDSPGAGVPTQTYTTAGDLKTWDFRTPQTYSGITNASGAASLSPALHIWHNNPIIKNLRFPSSTATIRLFGYAVRQQDIQVVLGSDTAISRNVAMIMATNITLTEAQAAAIPGITFAPSGVNGGTVTTTQPLTVSQMWHAWRYWKGLVANADTNDLWEFDGTTLNMGAWNLVNSTTITGNLSTTGAVTNTGSILGVYTSNAGSSTTWRFEDVQVGSSIIVYDSAGITRYFQQNITTAGDYNYYIPPGTTGTYTWAIEKYGSQRQSGSFAANTGGLLFYAPIYVEDVGLSVTNQATVAAYTEIETASKFYDRTALFRLTEQGIKLGQIATRSGTSIEIGTFSHVINKDAVSVYAISGNTITTKSTAYAGDSRYTTEIATPPATITANTVEVLTIVIEDNNGNSQLTVNGGDGTFQLWKVTTATATADYATGTLLATVGNGVYRFIGVSGFDIVGVDTNSNIRRRTSMAKGIYTQAFYVGDQIQLAQAPEVLEILTKVDILQVGLDDLPQTIMDTTVETGATVVESLRLHNSVLGAKVSGAGTGIETFRDLADTKDRLISTVDSNGNRLSEVDDLS